MRQWRRGLMVIAVATLLAQAARAEPILHDPSVEPRDRNPRAAISAALINVVFMPVRIMTTFIGAEFAGLVGFLTGGNENAANDVFDLVNGSQVVTPKMLEGEEQFHINAY